MHRRSLLLACTKASSHVLRGVCPQKVYIVQWHTAIRPKTSTNIKLGTEKWSCELSMFSGGRQTAIQICRSALCASYISNASQSLFSVPELVPAEVLYPRGAKKETQRRHIHHEN